VSGLTILRFGIDTLVFTFKGELSEELLKDLEEKRERAQIVEEPIPFFVGEQEMFVLPKGRGKYRYVLQRGDLVIQLTESRSIPTARVTLGAKGLVESGPEVLYAQAERLCAELGADVANALSRIDLAVDIQGFDLTHDDIRGFVCPANKRSEHFGGDRLETASWGKAPIMLRIYDKTQQVREKRKEWWHDVWDRNPAYDPAQRVFRCEAEIHRAVLKELGVLSVASALSDPGRLLDYAMRWCELRIPSDDQTKARWALDPRWEQIRQAVYDGLSVSRVRLAAALLDDRAVQVRFVGLVATHAARWGLCTWYDALESLAIDCEVYLDSEETDFAAETEKRRRRMLTA